MEKDCAKMLSGVLREQKRLWEREYVMYCSVAEGGGGSDGDGDGDGDEDGRTTSISNGASVQCDSGSDSSVKSSWQY